MGFQIFHGSLIMTLACAVHGYPYVYSHGSSHEISWGDDEDSLETMSDTAVPQYDTYFGSKNYEHRSIFREGKDVNGRDLSSDYTFYEPTSLNIRSYDKNKDGSSFSIHSYDHGLHKRDHHHDHHHGHDGGHHHGHDKHHGHDDGHHHHGHDGGHHHHGHDKHHGHDGGHHHHGHDGGHHHGHHGDHYHHHHGHHDHHKHK